MHTRKNSRRSYKQKFGKALRRMLPCNVTLANPLKNMVTPVIISTKCVKECEDDIFW